MSLLVSMIMEVEQFDGSTLVKTVRVETTVNPKPGDVSAEMEVARAAVRKMADNVVDEVEEKLDQYVVAQQ